MEQDGYFVVLLAVLLVVATVGATAPVAATQADEPTPAFTVALNADGSARLTLTLVYNLSTDAEQAAFDELQTNETAQAEARTRFRNRMEAVAADAANATGREMNVTDAAIELEETDDSRFGVVNLSVTYVGLAAVEDGTLTVTDPFASGFEPDRQFVVTAPDGYTVDSATPAADTGAEARVVYDAGTDLSGFELVVEEAATPTGTPTDTEAEDGGDSDETPGGTTTGGQPGFGAAAAIVALAGAALLSLRRR